MSMMLPSRLYNDNPNLNSRLYRGIFSYEINYLDSESFAKLSKDVAHLRNNSSRGDKTLYQNVM